MSFSFDGDILAGTGGSLKKASILLEDNFFMLNGDTFFDINLTDFVSFRNASTVARLALREIENSTRYSLVYLEDNLIKRFGLAGEQHSELINGGTYYLNHDILNFIPEGVNSFEKDVFPKLPLHSKISGEVFNRPFLDIGIPDDFNHAYEFLRKNYFRLAVFLIMMVFLTKMFIIYIK